MTNKERDMIGDSIKLVLCLPGLYLWAHILCKVYGSLL